MQNAKCVVPRSEMLLQPNHNPNPYFNTFWENYNVVYFFKLQYTTLYFKIAGVKYKSVACVSLIKDYY